MAGIRDLIESTLAKVASLKISNGDGTIVPPYVRIWNDQVRLMESGQMEAFPLPAFFVEIQNTQYKTIGQAFRSANNLASRIHLVTEFYNALDGTYEQDLPIFDLRDKILILLTYFKPEGCGAMTCTFEEQDFKHTNVYHYIMTFECDFTDSKASRLDPKRDHYVDSVPPTGLDVEVTKLLDAQPQTFETRPFIIPKR